LIKVKCIACDKEFYCRGDVLCMESLEEKKPICLCKKCSCKSKKQIKECGYRELGEEVEFT
jgi:hypothetical protein